MSAIASKDPWLDCRSFIIARIADGVRREVNDLEPARIAWGQRNPAAIRLQPSLAALRGRRGARAFVGGLLWRVLPSCGGVARGERQSPPFVGILTNGPCCDVNNIDYSGKTPAVRRASHEKI